MKIKNFQKNSENGFSEINLSENLTKPEIYYLVGALRDGCLTTQWTIKIKQKNRAWLSSVIIPLFKDIFNKEIRNNIYLQQEYSPVWYLAFKDKGIWQKLNELKNQIPETPSEQKFYIMGFWDADGGCPKNPTIKKKIYIKFTQKDKKSLEELKWMIENFGIKCGNVRISENAVYGKIWRFSITNKQGMIKFCNSIGSLHPEKKQRLITINNILLSR